MTTQDKIQFLIGQLTVSNMSLQEKIEQLEKENAELKKDREGGQAAAKPEKPKLVNKES